jgi:hypothetical protein
VTIALLWWWLPAVAHDPLKGTVTWDGEIGRLVQARCIGCHVDGGRGPMPLTSYDEARPWAKAMREEVVARRMPKWHAARGYGEFANDRSLTPFEIALIAAWVDGGAPKSRQRSGTPPSHDNAALTSAERAADWRPPLPSRVLDLPCTETTLPRGRLLGVRPSLEEGASAGISVRMPDGRREIVAWIRGFEKEFTETYWLRKPLEIPRGARLEVDATGRCSVTVSLG